MPLSDAKPWDSVFGWSRRFFGIDPVYGWLLAARQGMRGVGWLTVVGNPFLQVLDNSSSLEQLPTTQPDRAMTAFRQVGE